MAPRDPGAPDAPGTDRVVYGFCVMAYDIPGETAGSIAGGGSARRENGTTLTDQALFVSIGSDTLDELQDYWDVLTVGAVVVEPLAASAWSAGFGMLTDRFGVTWSVSVTA